MKAIILDQQTQDKIAYTSFDLPPLESHQVKVSVKAAALNHRDEWSRKGMYPNLKDGVVLGSDGAGEVVEIGSDVASKWLGQKVIINPALNWGNDQRVQSKEFKILGMPDHGTFAEYVQVPADRLFHKPDHLSWEEAAALPLGGLTAFRAVSYQAEVKKGDRVLVTGFGGGVAQFAAQFALSLEAEVYVSSGDAAKRDKALQLGMKGVYNYKDKNWVNEALEEVGGFDVIIDSAMGDTLTGLIKVCKPGGKIVFFGATLGNPPSVEARKIFWNQIKLMGTTMGSDQDFEGMLAHVNQHKIKPLIDQVFSLENALEAFDRMKEGKQLGKIILKP
ncbi:zinc-binding dehydrogenase [Pararhodonellum marinum]|uniref:zinc-binding dehydrogenase n=1 Tax=Pararhodonellum marinum TaxID=2755358 RepID=UPI00188F6F53|nr:zinc-binding dehydrogenase [Pararhodonellum marinum]